MNKIEITKAPIFTSPNPMTFICTKKPDGTTNLATLAFWNFASTAPGKIMFSLNKGAYSLELLESNKEVVLVLPGAGLTGALIGCGTTSGREKDKVAEQGIPMQNIEGTEICIPEESRLAIHATVSATVDADDHVIHVCNVNNVYANDDVDAVFGWKGYAEIALAQKQ